MTGFKNKGRSLISKKVKAQEEQNKLDAIKAKQSQEQLLAEMLKPK